MNVDLPVFGFVIDPELDGALRQAADRVLASRRYVLGAEVAAFEREFATYCGVSECIGVANGTDALELALRACGVGRGQRVATVANAGYFACTALAAIGAEPVFVDVDETLNMATSALERVLPGVTAIVVTHLYGRLAAIEEIVALAKRHQLPVIEDCAQAHGAERGGRRAGSFGSAGCFSFYPTKNLGAVGDGGGIVTSDPGVAARARALRQYGWSAKFRVEFPGARNSRLDELQAAFLRVKLPRLAGWNAARVAIASRYCDALRGLPIALPAWRHGEHVNHLFVVRVRDRETLRASLSARGIDSDVHYPIADHRQPVRGSSADENLPETEAACREVVTLPCYPGLAADHVQRVVEAVRNHYRTPGPTP
jgi:dTDP-3-amino-2,3,6-trideoxy-4-keto-D-glucose/dTDP-3-amino-3,4,6-trideoxy-alpha-D-glucose/dTDP-2,6-dideoxy-D-kanosamine transaminase